ncbi:FAD/NAD(P)-binding domain-containing protein [Daldinia caldariorum]|uniref:FAD/NAD(P)-binding domain-containing protein n=1 Tax=Daldinia caldariorum TaxID=326644 RepID=UPI0020080A3A|nr:FAD/NAD(P)-binding domain-containing protein [Daldinia caldariorum]KAI1465635.1 FAD/NAD(P)-binding domain-containing protein [Daldinia caldariorum]
MAPFRAINIGAGPVGLALANIFNAAGLDFVILERYHDIMKDSGAGIMLWPHTTRVFDQLGLTELCDRNRILLKSKICLDHLGRQVSNDPAFDWIEENHGYPVMEFSRSSLTKILLEGIEEHKARIKTSISIRDINMDEKEVRVYLQDGTVETGTIAIGCDGVHSQTRDIMQRLAVADGIRIESNPTSILYKCIYGTAKSVPAVLNGVFWESHSSRLATQFASSPEHAYFTVFERLHQPVDEPHVFTGEDADNYMEEIGESFLTDRLKVKDIKPYCTWKRLAYQPQGLFPNWYHGRIVLCGDSVIQMTSSIGLNFNAAFQTAVVLANKLYIASQGSEGVDTLEAITRIFMEYEDVCKKEMRPVSELAVHHARAITWGSWVEWILIEYIIPWIWGEKGMMRKIGEGIISKGRKLVFVHHEDKAGKIPWGNH